MAHESTSNQRVEDLRNENVSSVCRRTFFQGELIIEGIVRWEGDEHISGGSMTRFEVQKRDIHGSGG